jgi:DNA-directed RNA polymerase subunit F
VINLFVKEILSVKPITNRAAKEHLENIQKDMKEYDIEVGYEQEKSFNYVKRHAYFNEKQEKAIMKNLAELGIPEEVIIELINANPKHEETVKAILTKKAEADEKAVLKVLKA